MTETTKIDWNKILIRCSSLGYLFVEPRSKEDKLAGNLSETAKNHLTEVYANIKWGVYTEIRASAVKKGKLLENDAITAISLKDKRLYIKNDERKDNEWITGECDIDNEAEDEIIDAKCSVDALSFLPNIMGDIEKMHAIQLQGYMWLWNRSKARVAHVLLSMPDSMIEGERYSLLRYLDVATDENDLFKAAWEKRLTNLNFDRIPMKERIVSHSITRDETIIEQIPKKVAKAREYLAEIHEAHIKQYSK